MGEGPGWGPARRLRALTSGHLCQKLPRIRPQDQGTCWLGGRGTGVPWSCWRGQHAPSPPSPGPHTSVHPKLIHRLSQNHSLLFVIAGLNYGNKRGQEPFIYLPPAVACRAGTRNVPHMSGGERGNAAQAALASHSLGSALTVPQARSRSPRRTWTIRSHCTSSAVQKPSRAPHLLCRTRYAGWFKTTGPG